MGQRFLQQSLSVFLVFRADAFNQRDGPSQIELRASDNFFMQCIHFDIRFFLYESAPLCPLHAVMRTRYPIHDMHGGLMFFPFVLRTHSFTSSYPRSEEHTSELQSR